MTRFEDKVYPRRDFAFGLDGLHRLSEADRGEWTGSAIANRSFREVWTLTQTGNWGLHRLDADGNGDYHTGAFDRDEEGTFNVVNEQTALDRDLDGDTAYDDETVTPAYDAVGNLVDDGEQYEYVYDAFGRLRFVKDTSDQSVVMVLGMTTTGHGEARTGRCDGPIRWSPIRTRSHS